MWYLFYRSTLITTRLQRQGFDCLMLCRTFNKFLTRIPMVLRTYRQSQMLVECVSLPLFKKYVYMFQNVNCDVRSVM